MKCNHCGADIPDGSKFCNVCGEPFDDPIEVEKQIESRAKWEFIGKQVGEICLFTPLIGLMTALCYKMITVAQEKIVSTKTLVFIGAIGGIVYVILCCIGIIFAPKRHKIIRKQWYRDKTSICPVCGSHSVKVYRKGYNWQEAFWGSVFKIRGSRYTAGMDSNEAMCYCQRCGYKWNTHYDIRTIK